MSLFSKFCPSDAFLLLTANVLVQIAVVVALGRGDLAGFRAASRGGASCDLAARVGLRAAESGGGLPGSQGRVAAGFAAAVAAIDCARCGSDPGGRGSRAILPFGEDRRDAILF